MTNLTHDTNNRPYAKLSELKPGDKIQVDNDFSCLKNNSIHIILADYSVENAGELYIICNSGKHYFDGQLQDNGYLIGMYKV